MIYVIAAALSLAAITIGHKAWQSHRIYHFHEEG